MKTRLKYFLGVLVLVLAVVSGVAKENPSALDGGVQMASVGLVAGDVKNVKFEKFIIKKFRHVGSWIQEVSSKNDWVNQDAIKIPKRGGTAPKVLINNSVYPIASNRRDDDHVVVSLNKYDTENRTVTDDELYSVAYDKEGDVNLELKEELEEATIDHALHSISPSANSADTPVIETTGEDDGTGRKRLTKKDVVVFKGKLDDLKVPKKGRVLVLNSTHANDLLIEDSAFEKGYHNRKDGAISLNYYSFKVYEETYTPAYDKDNNLKAFGAVAVATDRVASIAIHKKSVVKASGSIKRFALPSHLNPQGREAVLGYKKYFGCFAIQDQGQAAIVSYAPTA